MPEQLDTRVLPLLPLTSAVVLPGMVVTITLETEDARSAADAARSHDGVVLLVPRVGAGFARVGTIGVIEDTGRLRNGLEALVIRGQARAVVTTGVAGTGDATWVMVADAAESNGDTPRARELARDYRATLENILEARDAAPIAEILRGIETPGDLADMSGYSPDLSLEQKVEILETLDVERRLERVLEWARETLAEIAVKDRIREEVQDGLDKRQREFILRQQLEAIRKELGEDSEEDVAAQYRKRIAEADMPEDVRQQAERELSRLERTSEQSP